LTPDQTDSIQDFARRLHRDFDIIPFERPPQCRNRTGSQIAQDL
jgi:hypothetical protein